VVKIFQYHALHHVAKFTFFIDLHNSALIRPGHPPASVSNSKINHNPTMVQLYDNYSFSVTVNIPFGMFTSFLANTPWSSALMKKAPTMSM
jgi:hypothetical protein